MQFQTLSSFPKPAWPPAPPPTPQKKRLKEIFSISGGKLEDVLSCLSGLRSEEHTSELQSPLNLVCRLLLEKKKNERHTSKAVRDDTTTRKPTRARKND